MSHHHSIELKLKGLALAYEARQIRRWEKRLLNARKREPRCEEKAISLRSHRLGIVRPEARATYLAYGFLKGRPYNVIEAKFHQPPNWAIIWRLTSKYAHPGEDVRNLLQRFEEWKQSAKDLQIKRANE